MHSGYLQRMIKLEYPENRPLIKEECEKELIFCICRKRWVILTPEEWVRQNFLQYLVHVLNYPLSLIAVERKVPVGEMSKRFDIVVFSRNAEPYLIVECKEMKVPLNDDVLHQALRYNMNIRAPFIVVTNGSYCAAFENMNGQFTPIDSLPAFNIA
jgi:hypothetical protein